MKPAEFWALSPAEFWLLADARRPQVMYGDMTDAEAAEIYQHAFGEYDADA